MTSLVLYIATSLDGYIARPDGSLDWLTKFEHTSTDYGYREFYATVDALVMGRKTYDIVRGFGPWPHDDRPCYVLTRSGGQLPHVTTLAGTIPEIMELLSKSHRRIWLVGGADLVAQALSARLLDEMIVSVMPVLLGSGIPLVGSRTVDVSLKHLRTQSYPDGVTQLTFEPQYGAARPQRKS